MKWIVPWLSGIMNLLKDSVKLQQELRMQNSKLEASTVSIENPVVDRPIIRKLGDYDKTYLFSFKRGGGTYLALINSDNAVDAAILAEESIEKMGYRPNTYSYILFELGGKYEDYIKG